MAAQRYVAEVAPRRALARVLQVVVAATLSAGALRAETAPESPEDADVPGESPSETPAAPDPGPPEAPPAETPPAPPPPEQPFTPPEPPSDPTTPAPPSSNAFPEEPAPAPAPAPNAPIPATPPPPAPSALAPPSSSPPAEQPPAPPAPPEDSVEKRDESHGVLGAFRIGPVLSAGLPSLLGFGGMIKLTKYLGAGINVGLVPEIQFDYYGDASVSYQEYLIYGHLHPFGGGFFIGAELGYASVRGTYQEEFSAAELANLGVSTSVTYESVATVETLILIPEIGFFHTFGSGFSLGIDAGLQIPIAPSEIDFESSARSDLPAAVVDRFVTPTDDKVESTLERVGRTIIPAVHLRVGWLL